MKRRQLLGGLGVALLSPFSSSSLGQYVLPPGQVRLVFNENPYGPSPKAIAAVNDVVALSAYYPDSPTDFPILDDLTKAIAQRHGLA
ncbi:MAG: histidinol-phosphate aminotransferase family protein, partial [Luminiphilus sp.]|nr:histidinol-phosphate aminotransferase family protein [Luminiphilus sp.]